MYIYNSLNSSNLQNNFSSDKNMQYLYVHTLEIWKIFAFVLYK